MKPLLCKLSISFLFPNRSIKVIQDGGLAKLKEYLEDYPNFAQAKVLELLWGLVDTEADFISEQLKT
jgi:hypothetical protein